MKRISMISYHTCPLAAQEGKETGGMNVYVLELATQLSKKGHKVDVYTRCQDKNQPHVVQINPNFRVIHIIAGPTKTIPKKDLGAYIPQFVKNYLTFVHKEQLTYTLMHCHYYMSGLAGIMINKSNNHIAPLVMTFHTLALMKNLVARDELETEEKERIDAEFLLTRIADVIITPSLSDKEYLKYLYECEPEKIYVIPPGYDEKIFRPIPQHEAKKHIGAVSNDKIVLFVGRIEPLKGIDGLMYAVKILHEKNPELKTCLWIVGGDISEKPEQWPKELQKLEELCKILHISTSVRFVGQKNQEELPYYLSAAELVVIPSHYESFGMAALEAMACGTPVITTNSSGISYLLGEKFDDLVTSAQNPLLLAFQMEEVLSNTKEYEKYSRGLREKVKDLTWENVSMEIEKIYRNFIHE